MAERGYILAEAFASSVFIAVLLLLLLLDVVRLELLLLYNRSMICLPLRNEASGLALLLCTIKEPFVDKLYNSLP